MIIIVFLYVGMGLFGYLRFGSEILGSITLNLPRHDMYDVTKLMWKNELIQRPNLQKSASSARDACIHNLHHSRARLLRGDRHHVERIFSQAFPEIHKLLGIRDADAARLCNMWAALSMTKTISILFLFSRYSLACCRHSKYRAVHLLVRRPVFVGIGAGIPRNDSDVCLLEPNEGLEESNHGC